MRSGLPRTIKLVVEYNGGGFAGWQRQRDVRTVQGELIGAVETMVRHPVDLVGAGRTDAGVHATGQVASFTTVTLIPARGFLAGLNRYLPADVAVRHVEEVPAGFHARFDALGKHYRYTLCRGGVRSVFTSAWSLRESRSLDLAAMGEAATHLVGEHDFSAFATRSKNPPATTVRSVFFVTVREAPPFVFVDVLGRGFLYNMVRTIAGTLLDVGLGNRSPADTGEVLRSRDRRRAGPTAVARGLCLMEVFYEPGGLETAVEGLSRAAAAEGRPGGGGPPGGILQGN